jgi:hypothetical protein
VVEPQLPVLRRRNRRLVGLMGCALEIRRISCTGSLCVLCVLSDVV